MLGELLGDGLQRGLVVAQLKLQAQRGREAMVGAGAAGQRIVGVVQVEDRGLHGGLHGAVGGEEGNLLVGVLGSLLGHVLQHELLGAGGAGLAGGVGSGHVHKLNAQRLGVGLEDVVAAHDGLHGHVAREGVVHEDIDAPLGALFHDGVALAGLVGVHDDVSSLGDDGGVFLRGAGDEEDVVPAMKRMSSRPISRIFWMPGVAPGTAWHITMALTSGSEAKATSLERVVSVSDMKLSG